MAAWDRRDPKAQARAADAALRAQLRDAVAPFSPFWRERLASLRLGAGAIEKVADLRKLPAVGERDVCPDGDPRGAARLVLQADEAGFAAHTGGPNLRKALVRRVAGRAAYQRQVEAEIRPTTYTFGGQAMTFPVASTRSDLDLVARAGNRAWQVLGLTRADVLVSAVPVAARVDHTALSYAALGAGAPALFPGDDLVSVAETLAVVPATVLAARADAAADLLADLAASGTELDRIRTLLLLGAPSDDERSAAEESLAAAGARDARVLALHGPAEGRVLWAECAPGTGLHTYPDLEIVELVDPETGDPARADGGGEIVVTQLGFRGSALLRWRTGDMVDSTLRRGTCRSCKRTVVRVPSAIRRGAFVHRVQLAGGETSADLRAVAGALAGRPDLADWRVEVRRSARTDLDELVVLVDPRGDETEAAVGAYRDVRAVAGFAPTQVVVVSAEELMRRAEEHAGSDSSVSERVSVLR
ncbi:MAG TPA: hypothetical protein VNA14_07305 [Mycobacteriales bacterium]|nr:hypothetical protein [Mycobacteriales bacterium]